MEKKSKVIASGSQKAFPLFRLLYLLFFSAGIFLGIGGCSSANPNGLPEFPHFKPGQMYLAQQEVLKKYVEDYKKRKEKARLEGLRKSRSRLDAQWNRLTGKARNHDPDGN